MALAENSVSHDQEQQLGPQTNSTAVCCKKPFDFIKCQLSQSGADTEQPLTCNWLGDIPTFRSSEIGTWKVNILIHINRRTLMSFKVTHRLDPSSALSLQMSEISRYAPIHTLTLTDMRSHDIEAQLYIRE